MSEELSKNYYAVIPARVRYDENLCSAAKLFYGEITALSNEYGYCFATDEYFVSLYKTSNRTIQRWISALIESGYISRKIIYSKDKKNIKERRLYIVPVVIDGNKKIEKGNQKSKNCISQSDKNVTIKTAFFCAENDKNVAYPGDKNVTYNIKQIKTNISSSSNSEEEENKKSELELQKSNLLSSFQAQYAKKKETFDSEYAAGCPDIPEEVSSFLDWLFKRQKCKINGIEILLEKILQDIRHVTLEQFDEAYDTVFSVNKTGQIFCKEMYLLTCLYNKVLSGM